MFEGFIVYSGVLFQGFIVSGIGPWQVKEKKKTPTKFRGSGWEQVLFVKKKKKSRVLAVPL
jgi:hypothetical protein